MDQPLIEVKNLSKRFNGRAVLDRVSFELKKGEVMSIIGKSGVGKSVLLKHIIGLLHPDDGQVLFKGRSIHAMDAKQMDAYLEKISYMFQNNALFSAQTVYDNVAMPLRYQRGAKEKQIKDKVMQRLEQMELSDAAGKYPAELSGGMQKRVALARSLISEPDIVLFDEPTTGQDPIRKNAILGMIAAYQQKFNFSAILISHDLPDVFFISNTILALYRGRIIFDGSPEDFENFEHPFRTEFIQSLELLQEELSGFYSKRQFKIRYQRDLFQHPDKATYAVLVFTLERMEQISEGLGFEAAQELLMLIGAFINKHFTQMGGFSTRYGKAQFVTVLPYAGSGEARRLADDFAENLNREGVSQMERLAAATPDCETPVDASVSVGMVQGRPGTALDAAIETAQTRRGTLVSFKLKCREKIDEEI